MSSGDECVSAAGLYIHVPFCARKCPYCDFYSVPSDEPTVDEWLRALEAEARAAPALGPFDTLYVGGGTPSVLSPRRLGRVLALGRSLLAPSAETEITVEVNPDDVTVGLLATLADHGVRRLSVGAQSFEDRSLAFLGRRHDSAGGRRALELARRSGSFVLSVDLICCLPGQDEHAVARDVERVAAFEPEHLSCYALTVEPRTPLGRLAREGKLETVGQERARDLLLAAWETLDEVGFEQYEVSSFSRPGHRSRHNSKYWARTPYLGLGPAAHSFDGTRRWWNFRDLSRYVRRLGSGLSPAEGAETLTAEQARLEALMLGLRTSDGVGADLLDRTDGTRAAAVALEHEGLVVRREGRVRPTRAGLLVADGLPLRLLP